MDDRLRLLLDKMEIAELSAEFQRAIDAPDPEAFANTFTDDGVMKPFENEPAVGREALKALAAAQGPFVPSVHFTTNSVIKVDGDRATQHSLLIVGYRREDRGGSGISGTGAYLDELSRTPDGWRFVSREVHLDSSPAALFGHIAEMTG